MRQAISFSSMGAQVIESGTGQKSQNIAKDQKVGKGEGGRGKSCNCIRFFDMPQKMIDPPSPVL